MTYRVTYQFLDKNKTKINQYEEACFSMANTYYNNIKNKAVYFKYIVNSKLTKEQDIEYIKFLNSIKWFSTINVKQYEQDCSYVFNIKSKNSFKTFATLTALRYLDENHNAVLAILRNKDSIYINKMKLLLLFGAIYTSNTGHNLNKCPVDVKSFVDWKLPKETFKPDNTIITNGLNDFFSTPNSIWSIPSEVKTNLMHYYKLK